MMWRRILMRFGLAVQVLLRGNPYRKDISVLQKAAEYQRLLDELDCTQADLARAIGKSRSYVANTIRLLDLPYGVKRLLNTGEITAGHGIALLTAKDPIALAHRIVEGRLSVRATERLVRGEKR